MPIEKVDLGLRSYDIHIGQNNLDYLCTLLKTLSPKQKSVVIVTEDNVAALYLEHITHILKDASFEVHPLILPASEQTKSLEFYEKVTHFCLEHKVERTHQIIALGGGVIGDLTGFVAATLRRGCGFIQVPTTLLAQVDSSVGGKTAINSPFGKNLIGAFYQPSSVLIDINFISTLSDRIYRSGYGEVIKYGLLGDRDFFEFLKNNHHAYIQKDPDFLIKIIRHCVRMKADIISADETEQGSRALLNLGHTFGHAYEAETGFSDLLYHGEAVAIGMYHAAGFSHFLGLISKEYVDEIQSMLIQSGFNLNIHEYIQNFNPDIIIGHMMQDKKVVNDALTLILFHNIGKAFIDKNINKVKLKEYILNI